jgi:RHS repeat-associated protein
LNLPAKVTFENGDYINYIYDASGIKLRQEVFKENSLEKSTDYLGAMIFQNDSLQFIQTSEGRLVPRAVEHSNSFEYQYHLKDHLGNVRTTFAVRDNDFNTSFEQYNPYFDNYDEITVLDLMAKSGTHSNRVSSAHAERMGISKTFLVSEGDRVNASVYAKYIQGTEDGALNSGALVNAFVAMMSGTSIGGETPFSSNDPLNGFSPASSTRASDDTQPKAYFNYILFDKSFTYIETGFKQLSTNAADDINNTGAHELLEFENINISQDGYLMIFVSNESEALTEVYFDDLMINHHKTELIQASDYYPFGMVANEYRKDYTTPQKYKYNGMEEDEETKWYFPEEFRTYDPALGRFMQIDPVIKSHESPYAWNTNNPILYPDPLGSDSTQRADAIAKAKEFVKKNPGNTWGFSENPKPGETVDCSGLAGTCMKAAGEDDARYAEGATGNGVKRIADNTDEISESEVEAGSFVILDNSSTGEDKPYGHIGIITDVEFDDKGNITNMNMIDSGGKPSSGKSGPRKTALITNGKKEYYGKRITGYRKWDSIKEIYNGGTMNEVVVKGHAVRKASGLSVKLPIPEFK